MCGFFSFLQISRLVQVMKVVYGDAHYNASKQPKWEVFAKKPTFVKVPLQGANECGHYTRSMREPMMVKRSLRTFEIMTWVLVELFTFPCLADYVFLFLMCHDF